MEPKPRPVDVEALLAERQRIEQLALRLVRDPDRAEDLAQDALVVGLEQGTRARNGLGAWLGGVTRRLAQRSGRGHIRRLRREERAARPESVPPTYELLVRTREQRRLLLRLEQLEEPFRTVVLLRYFEDLPPRRIAEVLDVPVATVKSRLHRGLARLRVRLDEDHGGDRRKWALALLPASAAQAAAAGAVLTGALLMGTKTKIATAAAAVLLAGSVWWGLENSPARDDVQHGQPGTLLTSDAKKEAALEGRGTEAEPTAPAPRRLSTAGRSCRALTSCRRTERRCACSMRAPSTRARSS